MKKICSFILPTGLVNLNYLGDSFKVPIWRAYLTKRGCTHIQIYVYFYLIACIHVCPCEYNRTGVCVCVCDTPSPLSLMYIAHETAPSSVRRLAETASMQSCLWHYIGQQECLSGAIWFWNVLPSRLCAVKSPSRI